VNHFVAVRDYADYPVQDVIAKIFALVGVEIPNGAAVWNHLHPLHREESRARLGTGRENFAAPAERRVVEDNDGLRPAARFFSHDAISS
jgi:hypothetical protein